MKTILLIEDTIDFLENLTECLEMEDYKILPANNGKRGIELARKFIPDLIICDIIMPEMDGYEVLHLILDMSETYEIPFIFSTSMSEKVDLTEAARLGADDYIVKPFDMELLLTMAKTWIQSGSKRHRNPARETERLTQHHYLQHGDGMLLATKCIFNNKTKISIGTG